MKLCHVVPGLEARNGGPSKSVRALCRALAAAGHDVELLTTANDAPRGGITGLDSERFLIRTFRRTTPRRLCTSPDLWRALDNSQADVIHHHALWLRTLHYAHRAARRNQVPLVISPRGMMSQWAWHHHSGRKRLARWLVHPNALRRAAGWHATSQEEATEIDALGFSQPVCVAPNGVEVPTPEETSAAAQFWHERCPETASRKTAVFYGRFHEKKRLIELIDVWLEKAPPDWLLLLVGIAESYTPEMLEDYARRMSGAGRVRAYIGDDNPPPYAVASLFLLPSHNENFGLAIAEALANGVPAVVTDTTPWGELNARGAGWCVSWTDYGAALAAAARESEAQRRQRGEIARSWVGSAFSWDRAARPLVEFYERVAKRPSGAT